MPKPKRNKASVAVYLLLWRNDKILIAKRCNTGYQDGNYQVPAGHMDAGEVPTETMIREAKEEIGIEIKESDLALMHVSFRPKIDKTGDRVDLFFETTKWSGKIKNMEPDKCSELRWVSPNKLPKNTTPHVCIAIECVERGEILSELSLELMKSTGMYKVGK